VSQKRDPLFWVVPRDVYDKRMVEFSLSRSGIERFEAAVNVLAVVCKRVWGNLRKKLK